MHASMDTYWPATVGAVKPRGLSTRSDAEWSRSVELTRTRR